MDFLEPWRNAPPARYAVESDSEDEVDPEDRELQHTTSSSAASSTNPTIRIAPSSASSSGSASTPLPQACASLVLAVADAGRVWSEGLDTATLQENAELFINGKKSGSLTYFEKQDTIVAFVAPSLSYEGMHLLSVQLISTLTPASITIIDSYSVPSYLSSTASKATIRYLATSTTPSLQLDSFDPPNIVTGLSASLASLSQESSIPCVILLFPSQLPSSVSQTSALFSASRTAGGHIPDAIYDYGGPSPYSSSPILAEQNLRALQGLAESLDWNKLGWSADRVKASLGTKEQRQRGASGKHAGFGWWKEERLHGEREIGEGGMYL